MADTPARADAVLIIASSAADANLYWATRFLASDPFVGAGVSSYQLIAFTPTHLPWRNKDFDAFTTAPTADS